MSDKLADSMERKAEAAKEKVLGRTDIPAQPQPTQPAAGANNQNEVKKESGE